MASLNRYRNYIDPDTKDGILLIKAATIDFKPPVGDSFTLAPDKLEAERFISTVKDTSRAYGYDFLIKNVPSERVETTTRADDGTETTTISFNKHINLFDAFSPDNLEICQKAASVTYGDKSFSLANNQQLRDLEGAELTATGRISVAGKETARDRMHSTFLATQLMKMLDANGKRSVELKSKLYTWTSQDGREEEYCGLTILCIILSRLKPHWKVDTFRMIEDAKSMTLESKEWNVTNYCDEMKIKKEHIDSIDARAYTDDAFVGDLFKQLKTSPIEAFSTEYERQEIDWTMGKQVESEALIDDASLRYTNMERRGLWTPGFSKKAQIIALTSEVSELKKKVNNFKTPSSTGTTPGAARPPPTGGGVQPWQLQEVKNGKEFGCIEKDGRTWYFCPHHSWNGEKCGMYVTHKPCDHEAWQERKDRYKKLRRGKRDREDGPEAPPSAAKAAGTGEKKKLALSERLQAALVTKAGLSEDQFDHIWEEVNKEAEN
jgi:hypothetical protein